MNEDQILELPPDERLKVYMEQMQESRKRHLAEQAELKKELKQKKKQEKFLKKQKEKKFDIDPKSRPTWKLGERSAAKEFDEKNKSYLPITDIHATTIHRTNHLIPRSYVYPEKPFKLTKNHGSEFGETGLDVLSKSGKKIIESNMKKFEDEVEERRKEEMKMKKIEFGPKWEYNKTHGGFYSVPPSDPYYFFEHQMKPKFFQTKPILRTSRYGGVFSYP
jgi:hypothetical protein